MFNFENINAGTDTIFIVVALVIIIAAILLVLMVVGFRSKWQKYTCRDLNTAEAG